MNYEIRPGRGLLSGFCCQFVNKQLHNKESANGPPKNRYSIHVALDTFPKNIYIAHNGMSELEHGGIGIHTWPYIDYIVHNPSIHCPQLSDRL